MAPADAVRDRGAERYGGRFPDAERRARAVLCRRCAVRSDGGYPLRQYGSGTGRVPGAGRVRLYLVEHENLFDVFRGRGMRGLSRRGKLRSLSALREKRELCVLCFPYALDRPDIRRFRSDGYVQERLGRVPGSGQGRRRGPDGRCVENLADGPVLYSGK